MGYVTTSKMSKLFPILLTGEAYFFAHRLTVTYTTGTHYHVMCECI